MDEGSSCCGCGSEIKNVSDASKIAGIAYAHPTSPYHTPVTTWAVRPVGLAARSSKIHM